MDLATLNLSIWLAACVLVVAIAIFWVRAYGWTRGLLATALRFAWLLPILLALYPRSITLSAPSAARGVAIHVLIDDSKSMKDKLEGVNTAVDSGARWIAYVEEFCARLGCSVRRTLLSTLDSRVRSGFTPLNQTLPGWVTRTGADPWILISDGGDFRPSLSWDPSLRGSGSMTGVRKEARALILGFESTDKDNIAITHVDYSPFAFEAKPWDATIQVKRTAPSDQNTAVQAQVRLDGKVLASVNIQFVGSDLTASQTLTVPSLPRGTQVLTITILPTGRERVTWDNETVRTVDVMPDTVGLLHLLGSPSWDGRFMRRYLKAEPKYDLISFYILRDPWDMQQVNERELSLIPFPVERLFRDELPNFRACVIQNFSLSQFLQSEYQENLVRYVQDGGGLLFIGGPRALRNSDLTSSPLRSILPFDPGVAESASTSMIPDIFDAEPFLRRDDDERGSTYDSSLKFQIVGGAPTLERRALATVYDDWEPLLPALEGLPAMQGMHNTSKFKFKEKDTTVLLQARTEGGAMPLVVASYPGKGRALWVFTDQFWRLALTDNSEISRSTYNRFNGAAMTWLLRKELRPPLRVKGFEIFVDNPGEGAQWAAILHGPASRYIEPTKEWTVSTCNERVTLDQVALDRASGDEWILRGRLAQTMHGGERCNFRISGSHGAFGSVEAQTAAIVPRTLPDDEVGRVPARLEDLSRLTGARLLLDGREDMRAAVEQWLLKALGKEVLDPPAQVVSRMDPYWALERGWIWVLLFCLPLEVMVRRWDQWFGGARRRRI